ncbi:MAG: hypothetical protein HY738_13170, partial [Bacteroidia bacterium]|nr:hypothetical protein [Bacteroidia bacterium]
MKKIFLLLSIFTYPVLTYSQYGDTVTVQTFTFGSPQDAWFVFPPDTVN